MNKSALVALCLGFLAVLSCLGPVVHGKPAPSRCCLKPLPCCNMVKRKEQAMAVRVHDAEAEVEHTGVRLIQESYSKA